MKNSEGFDFNHDLKIGFRLILCLLALLIISLNVLAVNDPGHDSLYVLKIGDSNITGTINLTGNVTATLVQATSRFFGPSIDIRGDGSSTANANQIIGTSTNLELSSSGNLILNKAVSGGQVFVGWPGTTTSLNVTGNILGAGTLNVSGNAFAGGSQVCTATNGLCVSGGISSAGGWTNDSTSTRTTLVTIVNSSLGTGSFMVQNQTGSSHLFVNGSSGFVGVGTTVPNGTLTVSGNGGSDMAGTTNVVAQFLGIATLRARIAIESYSIASPGRSSEILLNAMNAGGTAMEHKWAIGTDLANTGLNTFYIYDNKNASIRLFIDPTGNVGINTSTVTQTLSVNGGMNITEAGYIAGSQVCTAANGLCASIGGSAAGWTNDSTTTRTLLTAIMNNSNSSGSFIVQNQTGSMHLFVNGSSGRVGIGSRAPTTTLDVNGSLNVSTAGYIANSQICTLGNGLCATAGYQVNASGWTNTTTVSSTSLRVGIGTAAPMSFVEIANTSGGGGRLDLLRLASGNDSVNAVSGIAFSTKANQGDNLRYIKSAIYHQQGSTGFGYGDLIFANDHNGANSDMTTADEVMRMTGAGYLGIGSITPQAKLSLGSDLTAQKLLVYDSANNRSGLGWQSTEMRMFYPSDSRLTIGTVALSDGSTFTQRIRVDSTGYTAIGSVAPMSPLEVVNSTGGYGRIDMLRISAGNDSINALSGIGFSTKGNQGDNLRFVKSAIYHQQLNGGYGVGDLVFATSSAYTNADMTSADERMRLLSTGNLGIGTTNATQKLDVNGSVNVSSQLYVSGGLNVTGSSFVGGSQICTAANGLCAGGGDNTSWNESYARTIFGTLTQVADLQAANVTVNGSITNARTAITNLQTANTSLNASIINANTNIAALLTAAGGWKNTTVSTTTLLQTIVNSSSDLGSFIVQNQSEATHLFVSGASGYVGIGTAAPDAQLTVNGDFTFSRDSDRTISVTSGSSNGNALTVRAGSSNGASYTGGALYLYSGNSSGTTSSGSHIILAAGTGPLRGGNIYVAGGQDSFGASINGSVLLAYDPDLGTRGKVGIGVGAPAAMLDINSSSGLGSLLIQNTTGSSHLFVNGSSGYVGIGTATPVSPLQVNGNTTYTIPGAHSTVCFERFIGTTKNYTRCVNASGDVIETVGTFAIN